MTIINYTLNRNATVTISLTDKASQRSYLFRDSERRPVGTYAVGFSGVVQGYKLDGEPDGGVVEARLIPNGDYAWLVNATADDGGTMQSTGVLTVAEADVVLPAMTTFEVSTTVFTPNQDGYADRLGINIYMPKEATLTAYLTQPNSDVRSTFPSASWRPPSAVGCGASIRLRRGRRPDAEPPPDGDYTLVVIAEDKEGQPVRRETTITLKDGGLPQAEMVNQSTGSTVTWATMPYSDAYFTDAKTQGTTVTAPEAVLSPQNSSSPPAEKRLADLLTGRFQLRRDTYPHRRPVARYGLPSTSRPTAQCDCPIANNSQQVRFVLASNASVRRHPFRGGGRLARKTS